MNSATSSRNRPPVPKSVTHLDSSYFTFRYPTAMQVGQSFKIADKLIFKDHKGENFLFEIKKTTERTVLIICRRKFTGPVERDDGSFLRLYISMIGVYEKPKSAVLRSTDTSTSVEFTQESFSPLKIHLNYVFTLKCVFRRIETTILSNELRTEQERVWQAKVLRVCNEFRKKEEMAYVLKCPNLQGFFTGRKVNHHVKSSLVKRACSYSGELVKYFRVRENTKTFPAEINLDEILGYIFHREKKVIDYGDCITLYGLAVCEGLKFLKELTTDYLIKNLNNVNNELLVRTLRTADVTEDSRLFGAAVRSCLTYKPQIFDSDEWKALADDNIYCQVACSILFGFLLRIFTGDCGFPPGMEEETAEI